MTVELITGYSGTPHIGSDDVQHLLAGIVGGGSYALDTGKKLAIAVNSANSVTIDTGDAIIAGGAHVRVAAAEKLTVTSGAQGVKRNDLVCLRYSKASDNKESASLVVVKGTATSGTPADPAVNTGSIIDGKATVDMPLYRLPISGVSLGTPVKLFSVSPTLASLGDSVSQTAARVPGRVFVGSVVSTVESSSTASGHEARLFTEEEFTAKFGRPFSASSDYVGAMNADGAASSTYVNSATYFSSGNIWVGVPGGVDGNTIRMNYIVVLGD